MGFESVVVGAVSGSQERKGIEMAVDGWLAKATCNKGVAAFFENLSRFRAIERSGGREGWEDGQGNRNRGLLSIAKAEEFELTIG